MTPSEKEVINKQKRKPTMKPLVLKSEITWFIKYILSHTDTHTKKKKTERKEHKHITKENHQTTREETKRKKEQKRMTKTENK